MKLSLMGRSGAITALSLLLAAAACSTAPVAASGSDDACESVVVETSIQTGEEETHAGTFHEVGTDSAGRPLFKSDSGMSLQFIETGSILDDEYSTHDSSMSTGGIEPDDISLDTANLEDNDPVVEDEIRRFLQACGYWVIGKTGENDVAMYPMLKVSDCADDPVLIDTDSEWFRQQTHADEQEPLGLGNVVITCAPDGVNLGPADGGDSDDGVDKVGLGVGLTVCAVVLIVVAAVVIKKRRSSSSSSVGEDW